MLKINEVCSKTITQKPVFKGLPQNTEQKKDNKEIKQLSNVQNPIGISAPISYTYTGELNILGNLKAQTYKLANGQNVIILPKKGATVVKTYVNAGAMNEPEHLRGISHYIEHNLFNGTKELKAGEFFSKVNNLGASTNASTSFSTTDFYISSQLLKKNDLEDKIKLHSDMLQNPVFAPDMLDKERGPVISEISMVMDEPQNIAMNLALKNLYQINTKSPDLIAGTIENIKNITREDVVNYYNTHYTPDNFTTVITGDVDPEKTIALVSKYFTKQNPAKPMVKKFEKLTPIDASIRVDKSSDNAAASSVVMAFSGPENTNTKDKIVTELLLALLVGNKSSKLNKALENMHIFPEAGMEKIGNKTDDRKAIIFFTACSPDNVDETIKTIYKEIFAVQNGNITEKEFNIVKKQLERLIQNTSESSSVLNNLIGSSLLDKDINYVSKYEEILKDITLQDIQNVAKKYLDLNKVSIATVNPSERAATKEHTISFGSSADNNAFLPKEVYDVAKITNYKLHNNVEVVTNPSQSDITNIALTLKTKTPAAIKPGVAEVLAAMLNRGSMNKSQLEFFDEAETKGINILFKSTPEAMSCAVNLGVGEIQDALNLAKEVLLTPNLTQDNFEFAKEEIKNIVSKQKKSANANAREELFKHLPYATSKDTLLASLETVTLDDVVGLYHYIMQNASAVCTVSAPFEKNPELATVINNSLSLDFPKMQEFKPEIFNSFLPIEKNKIIAQADARNQADVVKCYKFKTNSNISDLAKFELLNTILGGNPNSRLFTDLREKQKLAYRVRSNVEFVDNTGVMSLSIKTTTDNPQEGDDKLDNLKKSLKGFDLNTAKMQTELVSDEELESAKLYLKTKILDNTETSEGKNALLSKSKYTSYGIAFPNLLLAEIDKVTKEDIRATANYIFQNPSLTSIVASKKTLDHFKTTVN